MNSRGSVIAYWVITVPLALECLVGGVMGGFQLPLFARIMEHLGYPSYFMTVIGFWYVLAGVALLVPRFPRLKEWTYAGLVLLYTGAIASRLAVGDPVVTLAGPVFHIALTVASWALRPPSRRDLAPS